MIVNALGVTNSNVTQQMNRYYNGVPPAGQDILSWYFTDAVDIKGIHIQVQQPPASQATFRVGSAVAGGGSGFSVTISAGALEGTTTGQTLEILATGYLYLYATTPAGCGDINASPFVDV